MNQRLTLLKITAAFLLTIAAAFGEAQQTNTNGVNIDTDGEANSFLTALARGTTITATELGYLDGVSSNLQTQLNAKQATISFGTGVQTSLGVNIGSAGAPVLFNGAGGTPSSLTLTNATGLPASGLVPSTSQAVGLGTIELGHASDTTLSRSASGKLAVEGVDVVLTSGTQTIAGAKTFSGQMELTSQSATNATSAMTRFLGDMRYSNLPDIVFDGQQKATDGVSNLWTGTVTGSGATAQSAQYLAVNTGGTTGSTAHFGCAPSNALVFSKDGTGGLGWVFDSNWIVTFRADIVNSATNTDGYFVIGQSTGSTSTAQPSTKSCGFRFHDQGVYAFVHNGTTYSESSSSLLTLSGTNVPYRYAIHCDDTNINFYINGSLVDSITAPTGSTGNGNQGIAFWVNNETTTNDLYIRVYGGIKFSNIP